jgi:hypothetical protein
MNMTLIGFIIVAIALAWIVSKLKKLERNKTVTLNNFEVMELTIQDRHGEKILDLQNGRSIATVLYSNMLPNVEIRHVNRINRVIFTAHDMDYFDMRPKDCFDIPIKLKVVVFYDA